MVRVAIVGGGIAGLTLAAALDPARHEVVLHEERPGRAGTGAALGLWPSAVRALARFGVVLEDADDHGPWRDQLATAALFDIDSGARLLTAPRRAGALALVARPRLLAALEAAVPPTVRRVHEAVLDPAALDADLVVGADGVRSRVRALVHPRAADRVGTPWLALRGTTDQPPPAGTVGEYWGPGRLAGITPTRTGTYWFTTHAGGTGPEPVDVEEALAETRARFAGAPAPVRGLLAGAGPHTLATRLWLTPPMPRYVRGRYVVIGDAAHATTPNLGRGAVDAVLDAVSLAQALDRGSPLRTWQLRRLPATQATRAVAPAVMRLALSGTATGPRNRLLRGAGRVLAPLG